MTEGTDAPVVHAQALCESTVVGPRTRIWAFAHVLDGASIGSDCNICDHAFIEGRVRVGDRVTVKNGVQLFDGVVVEDDVFLGPNCIFTNDLTPRAAIKKTAESLSSTLVQRGATIGANAHDRVRGHHRRPRVRGRRRGRDPFGPPARPRRGQPGPAARVGVPLRVAARLRAPVLLRCGLSRGAGRRRPGRGVDRSGRGAQGRTCMTERHLVRWDDDGAAGRGRAGAKVSTRVGTRAGMPEYESARRTREGVIRAAHLP